MFIKYNKYKITIIVSRIPKHWSSEFICELLILIFIAGKICAGKIPILGQIIF